MNAEQKQRTAHELGQWNAAMKSSCDVADLLAIATRMFALLQEMIDAPEQAGVPELARDAELLDAIEDEVKSRGAHGLTLCYASYAEDGYVLEKGFRVIGRKFIGPRKATLREAIDAAIAAEKWGA